MLNTFLSVWHIDLLTWCQLVFVGILTFGTVLRAVGGSRPHRSEIAAGVTLLLGSVVTLFTNNAAIVTLAFSFSVISATILALHAQRSTNLKAQKSIIALCVGVVVLHVTGTVLLNTQFHQWAFATIAVGTLGAFGIFFVKTRFTSFVGTAVPVVFFISLLRMKHIVDGTIGDGGAWTEDFFMKFGGILVLGMLAKLLFAKKRQLLSISSFEHIGLTAFMVGAGPAGAIPALLHLGGQAVAHSGLWYATQDAESVRTNTTLKYLCGVLFASLLGAPFSVLFISELIGVGYALQEHRIVALFMFAALAVMNVCLVRGVITLTAGSTPAESTPMTKHQKILAGILATHILIMYGVGGYMLTQYGIQFAVSVAENIALL